MGKGGDKGGGVGTMDGEECGRFGMRNVRKTGCRPCFVIVLILFRTSLSICLVFGPSISSYDSPLRSSSITVTAKFSTALPPPPDSFF